MVRVRICFAAWQSWQRPSGLGRQWHRLPSREDSIIEEPEFSTYKRILAPKGICVMVGGALSQVLKALLFGTFMSVGGKKMRFLAAKPNVADLEFIIKLVEEGKVKPVIDRRYQLHQTAEAMRYLSEGHARGKVIIEIVHP